MRSPGDLATVAGYRAGWRALRLLPEPAAYALADHAADATVRRGGAGVRRLRENYSRVRPELGPNDLDALVRDGMRRYLRYYVEAFRLPNFSRAELAERVVCHGDEPVRERLAAGRPTLAFLGHMGNWDLAGAWATCHLGPVLTVAERLRPEEVYADFLAFREGLGMRILPLTGGPDVFSELRAGLTAPVVLPLLADRDLTATGIEVDLCGHRASMAAGPAALAVATGTPLHPVSIRHIPRDRGWGIEIVFHPAVPVPTGVPARRRAELMTQSCADVLGEQITRHTADWHMLQRVFVEPVH